MPVKKQEKKPKFEYTLSQQEIAYKVLMNPDTEFYTHGKNEIRENGGYCLNKPKSNSTRCICDEFLNKNREGWCDCKLYKKVRRTEDEVERYLKNTEFNDDDDKKKKRGKRDEESEE